MTTALVLSGGGARGDFEVGALRFLYDQGVRPDIICGTSVGTVNGVKLAEGENNADPTQGMTGLEALWLELQVNTDMYLEEPWLGTLDPEIYDFLTGRNGMELPQLGTFSVWGDIGGLLRAFQSFAFVVGVGTVVVDKVLPALAAFQSAQSLYNLEPIREKLRTHLDTAKVQAWVQAGGRLRLAVVGLDSGTLRYVTETGAVLERDNATPVDDLTPPGLAPQCQPIADRIEELSAERRHWQEELRRAPPQEKGQIVAEIRRLNQSISEHATQLRDCIAQHPPAQRPVQIDLATGVLASSSMPGIFRPVSFGGETYVDGGVREVLPLQVAIDLGADTVYAIHASKEAPEPGGPYAAAGIIDIVARSLVDLAIGEIARDDARLGADGAGPSITLIQPTVDLHDATTIDPGLISIGMAYGFMRAADVDAGLSSSDRCWQLADEIALLRKEIWRLECLANGLPVPTEPARPVTPPDPALEPEIQTHKQRLQTLIEERRGLGCPMPADADQWSQTPERHPQLVARRDAQFVAQTVPSQMAPGSSQQVSVTMRNTGNLAWPVSGAYRLGSQNPQDNSTWGLGRVELPRTVGVGTEVTIPFTVTAPSASGTHHFQWRMLQEGVEWFGQFTPDVAVWVEASECTQIRSSINSFRATVEALIAERQRLQEELRRAPPQEKGQIAAEIRRINAEIAKAEQMINGLQQQALQLGCL
jgi:NTE family protein